MPESATYALVALIVLLTHFQEGVTGFGCTVLAVPFVTLLVGLDVAVPVLTIQAWVLAVLIILESRSKIVWSEFLRIVLLVGIGFPFGIWGAKKLPVDVLKWVLAVFMLVVGVQGLVNQLLGTSPTGKMTRKARTLTSLFLPLGGVIHGAFASGGPLVVIYAARALTDKTLFRVTLCMLWATLNTIMIAQWMVSGGLSPHIWKITAFCLPFTIAGMYLGNHAHYRINISTFRIMIYSVLIASGFVLAWSLIG